MSDKDLLSSSPSTRRGSLTKKDAKFALDIESVKTAAKLPPKDAGLPPAASPLQPWLLKDAFKVAWNALDENEERNANHQRPDSTKRLTLQRKNRSRDLLVSAKFQVPANYKGPHLPPEGVTPAFIMQLINAFKSSETLHYSYATKILMDMKTHLLEKESIVMDATIPEGGQMVVVGDIHGQLDDLLTVFHLAGVPSPSNRYIFNGDFVDRGTHSIEILLLIYSFKLAYPQHVFLNRGNHEWYVLNQRYAFEIQVKQKYDVHLYELIQETFILLPLATVLTTKHNQRIFITHGGIPQFPDFTIAELRKQSRRELLRHVEVKHRDDHIIEQLLWSDPVTSSELEEDDKSAHYGWAPNRRGAGILFGKKVTLNFVVKNDVDLIIRSHQMVDKGYKVSHERRLVTLFSASCYCGTNNNEGAVIIFEEGDPRPFFRHYYAEVGLIATPRSRENTAIQLRQQTETIQKLGERIYHKRHSLYWAFAELDNNKDGKMTIEDWAKAITKVLKMDLHWSSLWPFLGYPLPPGEMSVDYTKFLDLYQMEVDPKLAKVWKIQEDKTIAKLCMKFYEHALDLKQAFEKFDTDHSGSISYKEFVLLLRQLKMKMTNAQKYEFMRSIDADKNGMIDYKEFIDRFQVEFDRVAEGGLTDIQKDFVTKALKELAQKIFQNYSTRGKLKSAFHKFDPEKRGIPQEKFSIALKELGLSYSPDEEKMIFDFIDVNKNKHISFKEFKLCFNVVDKSKVHSLSTRTLSALTQLGKYSQEILGACVALDADGSGKLDMSELKQVFGVVKDRTRISEDMIEGIFAVLRDTEGLVDYKELMGSFRVRRTDTSKELAAIVPTSSPSLRDSASSASR